MIFGCACETSQDQKTEDKGVGACVRFCGLRVGGFVYLLRMEK